MMPNPMIYKITSSENRRIFVLLLYNYRRARFFKGYKFCGFRGFWGLPLNLVHQKLVEILLIHGLQTEDKTLM